MSTRHGQSPAPIRPDSGWLATWRQDIDAALARLLPGFEGHFGYSPGENTIEDPDPDGLTTARHLAAHPGVPQRCRASTSTWAR
jgi:hypothetical protein